ncbi:MAG: iron-sulfur cluster-binding protein [Gemmatimonadota bacterium]|nr:MAG: iron-sulfur cluster-binding protein [Gemmatimonadota bacterium]
MTVDPSANFRTRVEQALGDDNLRTALDRATSRLRGKRTTAVAAIDLERLRDEARAIREHSIRRLPEMLEQLERNLIANGCQVHWAETGTEATDIINAIARQHGVRRAVKSKSMTTEEIRLNEALGQEGVAVVETDLGEYIIQLADEPPSHITAPVLHKRAEDIAELFQRELGMHPTTDPTEICAAARRQLRGEFLAAELGISGCNFAIAETGTICIVTNEGNGRMVTSMAPVYVALLGIEKIVPRVEDAILLWQAVARSATGQETTVYFSMSSGPRGPGQVDGPREMHVVLLDNGRTRILERGYADALLCVRCGACLNSCPIYREIGGHAYGETAYSGPIGAVVTPLLADNPATFRELPYASSLCGVCREVCPVKIDLPRLLLDLRHNLTQLKASPRYERTAVRAFARAAERPRTYQRLSRIVRWFMRLLPQNQDGDVSKLPPPLSAWTRSRVFPKPATPGFRELWRARGTQDTTSGDG